MFDFLHVITAKASALFLSAALFLGITTAPPPTEPIDETSTSTPQEVIVDKQETSVSQENAPRDFKTTEQPPQTISTPVPVIDLPQAEPDFEQDNYQVCKDGYGQYATWSEALDSCTCIAGYDVNASESACVKIQPSQQVQQPDLSINESACQTAIENLESFQKQYTGQYTANLNTGTQVVGEGLNKNLTDQYNAELPTYNLLKQAACQVPASNNSCQTSIEKFNTILSTNKIGVSNYGYLQFPTYFTEIYYACQ